MCSGEGIGQSGEQESQRKDTSGMAARVRTGS